MATGHGNPASRGSSAGSGERSLSGTFTPELVAAELPVLERERPPSSEALPTGVPLVHRPTTAAAAVAAAGGAKRWSSS